MVSVLPAEYDVVAEVTNTKEEFFAEEMTDHKPECRYLMNKGCVEEQNAILEKPHLGMKIHLKPFFIKAKVDNYGVNKVLVDNGTTINLTPHSLLRRIGKFDTDLRAHNMVLSNYEGKTDHSLW